MEQFFATVPRGLETLLAEELAAFGVADSQVQPGGLGFRAAWSSCYRANLESRLATRILWRIAEGPYRSEDDLYKLALRQPWPDLFSLDKTLRVFTTAVRCPLKSLDFLTLRIKDAVCDAFRTRTGNRPNVDIREPDIRVHVFLTEDRCTLYLDTSGAPLWQRGLRHANVEAPLKENLAAGILKLSGWQPGQPLLDPMCGSGTFLLEAACISLDRAPGLNRVRFGFEHLAHFEPETWKTIRGQALARQQEPRPLPIFGSDVDQKAVRASRHNLKEAGFGNVVAVQQTDFLSLEPPVIAAEEGQPTEGILVANPPYGERMGERTALAEFYPSMGDHLKRHFSGWTACFFTADPTFARLIHLKPRRKIVLFNGPLECRLYQIPLVAGSNRKNAQPIEPAEESK